jgi:hypothetical protein
VFLRDLDTNTTSRIAANASQPSISADGRFVAATVATPDPSRPYPFRSDIYVYDLQQGTRVLGSPNTAGLLSDFDSSVPSLSADGTKVAFESAASDLTPADTDVDWDVFTRDLTSGTTTLASVGTDGSSAGGFVGPRSLSADGTRVAFASTAENLVAQPTAAGWDDFVRDVATGTTMLVTASTTGGAATLETRNTRPSISADGTHVAFWSGADNLVPGHSPNQDFDLLDAYVRDLTRGLTTQVNRNAGGAPVGPVFVENYFPDASLDATGGYVAFPYPGSLFTGDSPTNWNVYVRVVRPPEPTSATPATLARGSTTTVTVHGFGFATDAGLQLTTSAGDSTGVQVTSVQVLSPTTLQASVTLAPSVPLGGAKVVVTNPGPGPGAVSGSDGTCACLAVTN